MPPAMLLGAGLPIPEDWLPGFVDFKTGVETLDRVRRWGVRGAETGEGVEGKGEGLTRSRGCGTNVGTRKQQCSCCCRLHHTTPHHISHHITCLHPQTRSRRA